MVHSATTTETMRRQAREFGASSVSARYFGRRAEEKTRGLSRVLRHSRAETALRPRTADLVAERTGFEPAIRIKSYVFENSQLFPATFISDCIDMAKSVSWQP